MKKSFKKWSYILKDCLRPLLEESLDLRDDSFVDLFELLLRLPLTVDVGSTSPFHQVLVFFFRLLFDVQKLEIAYARENVISIYLLHNQSIPDLSAVNSQHRVLPKLVVLALFIRWQVPFSGGPLLRLVFVFG